MKTAMILAAGRGERLKPITNALPKALCQVQGKPLIEHHVANLAAAGFNRIIINHAHLGSQIRQHLGKGEKWKVDLHYSPEPPGALETGGGIYNALKLLGNEPFLAVNADIYTHYDFKQFQLPEGSLAHLILGKNPPHNLKGDFSLTENKKLSRENPCYTFLGIAAYHPKIFETSAPGRYSLTPMFHKLIEKQAASGTVFDGLWVDIGTVARLEEANKP